MALIAIAHKATLSSRPMVHHEQNTNYLDEVIRNFDYGIMVLTGGIIVSVLTNLQTKENEGKKTEIEIEIKTKT